MILENNLKQALFLKMGDLFRTIRLHLDQEFKAYDLARPEWLLLAVLRVHPEGVSQTDAKAYVGVETSYFTKVLNTLEQRKFIIREIDPQDRRNRIIKTNKKSAKQLNKIFQIIYDITEEIQQDLTNKQLQELHQTFDKIGKRLEKYR